MKKLLTTIASALLLGYVQLAIGDPIANEQGTPNSAADVAAKIQRQLELRYPVAQTTPDMTDLVAPGAVIVLQKDNLVMNKVFLNGTSRQVPTHNVYENGEITQTGFLGTLGKVNAFLGLLGNTEAPTRYFARGEKVWVTRIASQADGIEFQFMSDPINNARLHGTLKFPYTTIPPIDEALALVASVFTTDPPFDPGNMVAPNATSIPGSASASSAMEDGEVIRRAAEAGDVTAMYQLGNVIAQQGDNVGAARWFRSASDRGHVKATNALGFLYEEGKGVPQNYAQANTLYLRAVKQGNADSMVNRGLLYANGVGVAKDSIQAYMHFLLGVAYATDQETRDAATKLRDGTAAKLSKQQLARGQAMADKFARTEIK